MQVIFTYISPYFITIIKFVVIGCRTNNEERILWTRFTASRTIRTWIHDHVNPQIFFIYLTDHKIILRLYYTYRPLGNVGSSQTGDHLLLSYFAFFLQINFIQNKTFLNFFRICSFRFFGLFSDAKGCRRCKN